MRELHTVIPDPDVVLALEPEELAGVLLQLMRARTEGETFNSHNMILELRPEPGQSNGYPASDWKSVELAVSEAFAWLEAQALLVPQPRSHGGSWKVLSRRARRLKSEEDFRQFQMARRLNRDLLHPAIAGKVWLSFIRGDFAEAIFTAMRAVEITVREAAGFPEGDHGVPMIRRAFHKETGPLRDPGQEEAEREALMHLFAGAIGSYKNPHSHRAVAMDDPGEAIEIVMLASHLLRIVDARRSAQQERQTRTD